MGNGLNKKEDHHHINIILVYFIINTGVTCQCGNFLFINPETIIFI